MSILKQYEFATTNRLEMIRRAFWLEYLTIAWMTVEAAVAIASGIAANSLTLVAFGIDSIIELASAGVLVWRLTVEPSNYSNEIHCDKPLNAFANVATPRSDAKLF